VKVKITALQMDHYMGEAPYLEMPRGVNVLFYAGDMKMQSSMTANYAKRYERSGLMEAKNDVVVVNEKGEKLNTEHLIWDEANDRIYSDEFVKITTAEEIIYGTGFESNMYFTRYKIFNIKGVINLKK
jgi:LPS export ABC transporter protein LptC